MEKGGVFISINEKIGTIDFGGGKGRDYRLWRGVVGTRGVQLRRRSLEFFNSINSTPEFLTGVGVES